MRRKKLSHSVRAQRYLQSYDSFGQPIEFNFNGSDSFKTNWGAFISIIVTSLIVGLAIYRTIQMWTYNDNTVRSAIGKLNFEEFGVLNPDDLGTLRYVVGNTNY